MSGLRIGPQLMDGIRAARSSPKGKGQRLKVLLLLLLLLLSAFL